MFKRFDELNFIIGLFFSVAAVILLVDNFMAGVNSRNLNLYTGIAFLIFGILMILVRTKSQD